jgi:hypothetical protein
MVTKQATQRGARTAIASTRVAIDGNSRPPGGRAGEPATSSTSARWGEADVEEALARQFSLTSTPCEHSGATNLLGVSLSCAPPFGTRTSPCATQTAASAGSPMDSVDNSKQLTTFSEIERVCGRYARTVACVVAPSVCVASSNSAADAGTFTNDVHVATLHDRFLHVPTLQDRLHRTETSRRQEHHEAHRLPCMFCSDMQEDRKTCVRTHTCRKGRKEPRFKCAGSPEPGWRFTQDFGPARCS